jgi:hypothetical protein
MPKLTKAQKELRYLQRLEKKRLKMSAVRGQYRDNLRVFMAEQNYVHRIHDYLGELVELQEELKTKNSTPLVDPLTGLVSEDYIDLESTRVRIVALKTVIDVNFRLLNKILPDAKAELPSPSRLNADEDKTMGETFLEALSTTERAIEHIPPPKLLN